MKIRVIWAGKTKEQFILEGINKFLRLLKPYAGVSITEVKEEKGRPVEEMLEKEGERILKLQIPYVLLDEKGKNLSSPEFARFLEGRGASVNFVLGGAYGVSDRVKERSAATIALSKMTFTHEMARLFLLEQVYRAFTIMQNRGYHH